MTGNGEDVTGPRQRWQAIGTILSAHAIMLRDVGLIGDDALATLIGAIESVAAGRAPEGSRAGLVAAFDERVDALTPAGMGGALRVGRGTADVIATAARLTLREDLARAESELLALREAMIAFAEQHVVSLMPAFIDGQIAQPTTLGHLTGAFCAPLARVSARLHAALVTTNRSPMGGGALASSGMPIDRERVAELLGFDGLVVNTLDAVSATDHLSAAADAPAAAAVAMRRFLDELLIWTRAEPTSFRLPDAESGFVAQLPQTRLPAALVEAAAGARRLEATAQAARALADHAPWGPWQRGIDGTLDELDEALDQARRLFATTQEVVARLEVNRALLANRAGKGFSTSSDLADFLMLEEQIDPAAARNIAALTVSRTREQGLEASGITPELIDGAALMVIGREIKAEFEAISRYLAPRRFIERRVATGAPSPAATRAALEAERTELAADRSALAEVTGRWTRADDEARRVRDELQSAVE